MEAATKRKRIARELLASSDFTKVCNRLDNKIDRAIVEIQQQRKELFNDSARIRKELFPEPYKDWRQP